MEFEINSVFMSSTTTTTSQMRQILHTQPTKPNEPACCSASVWPSVSNRPGPTERAIRPNEKQLKKELRLVTDKATQSDSHSEIIQSWV
jgi:hypothetical protein